MYSASHSAAAATIAYPGMRPCPRTVVVLAPCVVITPAPSSWLAAHTNRGCVRVGGLPPLQLSLSLGCTRSAMTTTVTVTTVVVAATVGGYSSFITTTSLPQTHEAHITAIPSQVPQSKKTTSRYHHHHYSTVEGPTRPVRTPNNLNDSDKGVYQCKPENDVMKTAETLPAQPRPSVLLTTTDSDTGSGHSTHAANDYYTGVTTTITITKQRR
ncbi:hypothetical protein EDB89DRAFT_1908623 [Lactarius sanguifluus]|nr:hypothetical protein EDB89DRAFT_1908623 [Lactarius sanguifluus]